LKLDPNGKVIGHLECQLTPAVVIRWEKLIDMGVLDEEANAPPQLVKFRHGCNTPGSCRVLQLFAASGAIIL
jgi:hypothetical protein